MADKGDVPVSVRQRICVWFEMQLGNNCAEIVLDLWKVFGQDGLKKSQVANLLKQFREGRTQMSDLARPGHPWSVRTDQNINRVRQVVENDRRSGLHKVANETGCSYNTVRMIIQQDLHLKKCAAKQIPHELMAQQ